ncbi:MAG: Clp protease N-terminal domain-containing protein [Solirubrobacteraceae bacterium]|nr:Clp protease N-terminal domain-containing protein [Solirubrobacteraceae bacterium]
MSRKSHAMKTHATGSRAVKAVVLGAEQHAEGLGDSSSGPEHLLLAALDLPDGAARRSFERISADPDGVRDAIIRTHEEALRGVGIEPVAEERLGRSPGRGRERLTSPAAHAIRLAASESKRDRTGAFGAHIVAGIAQLERGTAVRALEAMGIDRDELLVAARVEAVKAARRREEERDED